VYIQTKERNNIIVFTAEVYQGSESKKPFLSQNEKDVLEGIKRDTVRRIEYSKPRGITNIDEIIKNAELGDTIYKGEGPIEIDGEFFPLNNPNFTDIDKNKISVEIIKKAENQYTIIASKNGHQEKYTAKDLAGLKKLLKAIRKGSDFSGLPISNNF
jgi:hypothetical protein